VNGIIIETSGFLLEERIIMSGKKTKNILCDKRFDDAVFSIEKWFVPTVTFYHRNE